MSPIGHFLLCVLYSELTGCLEGLGSGQHLWMCSVTSCLKLLCLSFLICRIEVDESEEALKE